MLCWASKSTAIVRALAAGVILLFALLQWKSMKIGSGVQDLTTILKAALFLVVVAVCFSHSATPAADGGGPAAPRFPRAGRCSWPSLSRCRR